MKAPVTLIINTSSTKLVVVYRETHVAHSRDDIRDPTPIVSLFEYVLGKFNEFDYENEFNRIWNYETALYLARKLRDVGFRVYVFEHHIYEAVLFVKITDTLYAIIAPPQDRDEDLPVVHPIYIITHDPRIELPQIAQLITYFWLDKIRGSDKIPFSVWKRLVWGFDELYVEFDFEKRKAKCKRIPVYRTRLDKAMARGTVA